MAGITTHVLDNLVGLPGAGMKIDFSARVDGQWKLVKSVTTNADGRTDAPILPAAESKVGEYELAFHLGDYYEAKHGLKAEALFVDRVVPLRFALFDTSQHFHVPMLCTPWSCGTYRGS
jgi:5-hydroxyisourate hydrolase